jgi:hypothetical protein
VNNVNNVNIVDTELSGVGQSPERYCREGANKVNNVNIVNNVNTELNRVGQCPER